MATIVTRDNTDLRDEVRRLASARDTALRSVSIFQAQTDEAERQIQQVVDEYNYNRISEIIDRLQNTVLALCSRLDHLVDIQDILRVQITHADNTQEVMYMCSNCLHVLQADTTRKYPNTYTIVDDETTPISTVPIATIFSTLKLPIAIEVWAGKQPDLPPPLKHYLLTTEKSPDGPGLYLGLQKICD